MFVSLASNPFISSYAQSDLFGKLIIITLILLSAFSWAILVAKLRYAKGVERGGSTLTQLFQKSIHNPLNFEPKSKSNSFLEIYHTLRRVSLEALNKNRIPEQERVFLSSVDIESVTFQIEAKIAVEKERFEKHLFWLATTASLAPFLGLLGTVWGILLTFSELQNLGAGSGSPLVLGGLSMALSTTVLGLVIAIPALVGHSILKAKTRTFESKLRSFATQAISAVELQYRKIDTV